jgi:hypothetical protein
MYEVFPLELKLTWVGEIIGRNKSEIYCVTMLNSAIKNIIKPLIDSHMANPERYLNLDNVWVHDNSLYLFLKNKGNAKALLKTENMRQDKRFYKMIEGNRAD